MSLPQLQNLMKRDPEVGPLSSKVHVRGFLQSTVPIVCVSEAYSVEFDQQWSVSQTFPRHAWHVWSGQCCARSHFDSQMEIFKLKPQKPSSSFAEQARFASQCDMKANSLLAGDVPGPCGSKLSRPGQGDGKICSKVSCRLRNGPMRTRCSKAFPDLLISGEPSFLPNQRLCAVLQRLIIPANQVH